MKILLVQPPMTLFPWEMFLPNPPLGLAYLGGYLEEKGHKVEILDAFASGKDKKVQVKDEVRVGLDWKSIAKQVELRKPDVVGINSLFSSQADNMQKVARLVKDHDKDIPVVVGGAHVSSVPREVLSNHDIDYVVIGEGEETLRALLARLERGKPLSDLDGFAYRQDGNVKVIPKTRFIEDLDVLPMPARHLLPMEQYGLGRGAELMRTPSTTMTTSRGCPMHCVFCSIHSVFGWKWRSRSPRKVVEEIELLVNKYGIREIHFVDDNLTLNKKRMMEICDLIVQRGLDIRWAAPNGVAIWTLDKELLIKMKKSGCYSLCFGIESGDPDTLKFIGKPINLTSVEKTIKIANQTGIWTHGFFVFGFPYETERSVMNTLSFAVRSDLDLASFFIATPYPATRLYEIMKKEGMITNEDWAGLRTMTAVADTKYFKKEELDRLQIELYKAFFKKRIVNYMKPRVLYQRLKRLTGIEVISFIIRLGTRYMNILKKG
jgi:anaerobic magnesium-protoporphyrin IX monomethyl ester cyclase